MRRANENTKCPCCLSPIAELEETVCCPECGVVHHAECWQVNGKCSTYGCEGWQRWSNETSNMIAPEIIAEIDTGDVGTEPSSKPSSERLLCMECGEPVKRGQIICLHCRIKGFRLGFIDNCTTLSVVILGGVITLAYLIMKQLS